MSKEDVLKELIVLVERENVRTRYDLCNSQKSSVPDWKRRAILSNFFWELFFDADNPDGTDELLILLDDAIGKNIYEGQIDWKEKEKIVRKREKERLDEKQRKYINKTVRGVKKKINRMLEEDLPFN